MTSNKYKIPANKVEVKQQNQDFQNIPSSSSESNPPEVDKKEVQESSKNKSGKTDNTK